jgi:tRNA 2-thiocytidine biosynthesis protein TtcA
MPRTLYDALPTMSTKVETKLLHGLKKAISDYSMIEAGDRIMVCLSGGKDSFTLLSLLSILSKTSKTDFSIFAYTLDQSQPGWDDSKLKAWLTDKGIEYVIETKDTYSVVIDKIPEGKTYCSLCSRLRRGNIYRYAKENHITKVALGHHRDDLITTLLMSILYAGQIKSMPPKLLTDDKAHIVIRPLAYCQETDIIQYAGEQRFPIIPCNLCGSQQNLSRVKVKKLLSALALENPKIPGNILHALQSVQPSQLMDHHLWDFKGLSASIDKNYK